MKRTIMALAFGAVFVSGLCWADDAVVEAPDDGSDPDACGAVLCLTGVIRDDDCNKYVTKYFSIEKYKHGHFSPSRTMSARGQFLDQCKDDSGSKETANNTWGGVQRGF
ncbi:TrbM/KikA/MpfK family conjugal transfer protein [Pseudomonas gingeri]